MHEKIITLKDRKKINENTLAMWFDKADSNFIFEPGQYAQIKLLNPIYYDEEGNSRLFSICSSPTKNYLMFTTRALDSAFNKNILELPIGSEAVIGEPGGNTVLHKDSSVPAVFLIGGIGITPVRCMIEYITECNLHYKSYLFFSNPDSKSMAFFNEFEKWAKEYPDFKFIPTIDDINDKNWKYNFGYINKDMILKNLFDVKSSIYYVVGPPQMVDVMEKILLELKVNPKNIKLEKF
jgi:ferredoxin-NADP reductase